MTSQTDTVASIIYDEIGVLAHDGRRLSEAVAKKVVAALNAQARIVPEVPPKKAASKKPKQVATVEQQLQIGPEANHIVGIDPKTLRGITKTNDPRIEIRNQYILDQFHQGVALSQLATELGLSRQRIDQLAVKLGINRTAVDPTFRKKKKFGPERKVDYDEVKKRRNRGDTLDKIATDLGVSRQAIARISRLSGVDSDKVIAERKRLVDERRARLVAKMKAYIKENPNSTREQALSAVGVSDDDRRAVLEGVAHQWPRADRTYQNKFSDQDILKALRRVRRKVGGKWLTAKLYDANRNKATDPSTPLIYNRFGSWIAACQAANVKSGVKNREYTSKYDRDDVDNAVKDFLKYCSKEGLGASYREYEQWQRTNDSAPSGTRVRREYQDLHWRQLLQKVQE